MATNITFVHTSPAHIERFNRIMAKLAPEKSVKHIVNSDLLTQAMQSKTPTNEIKTRFEAIVDQASQNSDVVVCTCSTLGTYVNEIQAKINHPVLRIDQAMADKAVQIGQRIVVAATLESTLQPTYDLIEETARNAGKSVEIIPCLCTDAWAYFEQGDYPTYVQTIVETLAEYQNRADVIVLAQASMADAAEYCADFAIPVLSSPVSGVQSALQAIS